MSGLAIFLIFVIVGIMTGPRATGRWLADVHAAYLRRMTDHRTGQ